MLVLLSPRSRRVWAEKWAVGQKDRKEEPLLQVGLVLRGQTAVGPSWPPGRHSPMLWGRLREAAGVRCGPSSPSLSGACTAVLSLVRTRAASWQAWPQSPGCQLLSWNTPRASRWGRGQRPPEEGLGAHGCPSSRPGSEGDARSAVTTESESQSRSVVSNSLQPCGLYSPWNSPGQNTREPFPRLLMKKEK